MKFKFTLMIAVAWILTSFILTAAFGSTIYKFKLGERVHFMTSKYCEDVGKIKGRFSLDGSPKSYYLIYTMCKIPQEINPAMRGLVVSEEQVLRVVK